MSWLDDELGKILDNGTEVEGLGGLNFIGFTITPDTENMRINIAVAGAATGSDDVSNESSVSGSSVSDALDTLGGQHTADAAAITALTITGAGKLPYVSGTPGTYSASTFTTDGAGFIGVQYVKLDVSGGTGTYPSNGLNRIAHRTVASGGQRVIDGLGEDGLSQARILLWNTEDGLISLGANDAAIKNVRVSMATGGAFQVRINGTTLATLNATGLDMTASGAAKSISGVSSIGCTSLACAGPITTVTTLNGATVAAPVEGTALTDADQTLNVSGGNDYTQSTALTASRTKTLGTSGSPETGEVITIKRFTTAAFTMPIVNGGAGAGTLYTFPSAGKRVADFRFDGTNWVFLGCKRLA